MSRVSQCDRRTGGWARGEQGGFYEDNSCSVMGGRQVASERGRGAVLRQGCRRTRGNPAVRCWLLLTGSFFCGKMLAVLLAAAGVRSQTVITPPPPREGVMKVRDCCWWHDHAWWIEGTGPTS